MLKRIIINTSNKQHISSCLLTSQKTSILVQQRYHFNGKSAKWSGSDPDTARSVINNFVKNKQVIDQSSQTNNDSKTKGQRKRGGGGGEVKKVAVGDNIQNQVMKQKQLDRLQKKAMTNSSKTQQYASIDQTNTTNYDADLLYPTTGTDNLLLHHLLKRKNSDYKSDFDQEEEEVGKQDDYDKEDNKHTFNQSDTMISKELVQLLKTKGLSIEPKEITPSLISSLTIHPQTSDAQFNKFTYLGNVIYNLIIKEFKGKTKEKDFQEYRSYVNGRYYLRTKCQEMGLDRLIRVYQNDWTEPIQPYVDRYYTSKGLIQFIGALFMEKGFLFTRQFILDNILNQSIEKVLIDNPESSLFKKFSSFKLQPPRFEFESINMKYFPLYKVKLYSGSDVLVYSYGESESEAFNSTVELFNEKCDSLSSALQIVALAPMTDERSMRTEQYQVDIEALRKNTRPFKDNDNRQLHERK
ncbi:hypothetical protein DFA_09403 [Cavenderia fasciculata]|uniref:RNase III domain-containing protein n=1 Tax=Cavenderia fasciculata TaxID=261658 RepID=F4Q7J0_CACFS|nr:uncharacterized protein DFA_09403 [Cavenderia fasciculata]EGG16372.1 hypothetical protein DFA_09403 [Cavenderia fasciculata]|eukprot:XP_004354756.1 hypothetical protein DFA_09403 [Cavenderia fasciculata]